MKIKEILDKYLIVIFIAIGFILISIGVIGLSGFFKGLIVIGTGTILVSAIISLIMAVD